MSEIAGRVLLGVNSLTRLIDRLFELAYVTRCAAVNDGRGSFAELTHAGAGKLDAARRTHREGVRRCSLDRRIQSDRVPRRPAWRASPAPRRGRERSCVG